MSWAGRRRAIIIAIATLLALAALAILFFSIFYKVPTCTDRKQNQGEAGVDCGGECQRLCPFQVSSPPAVRFVRVLSPQSGRTDVIAYVDNPNLDAEAKGAPFLLEVYDANQQRLAQKTVKVDLPASMTVPVYLPDVARGEEAAQAFLTPVPEDIVWTKAQNRLTLPTTEQIVVVEGERPRVTATLVNPLAKPFYDTTLVATIFDVEGNVIAASQTLVPTLPSQGTVSLVFTWNAPFSVSTPRVEILPVPKVGSRAP
ncbi:MAG TPA: hypothetical protein VF696_01900 [Candidatus Paceibacterota bacterium]|jgi:hypothetical protein